MKFLADESCDFLIVRTLRDQRHDVVALAEESTSMTDETVAEKAHREDRILITEDRDFGYFVYALAQQQRGVLYLRYPFPLRARIAQQVEDLVETKTSELDDKFVVVEPGRNRIRPTP